MAASSSSRCACWSRPRTRRWPPTASTADAIDWLVPHQANIRIIDATAKKLGVPHEKVITTVDRHANTSAASIPLALDEAARDGRIAAGQRVMLLGVGGGFTWGSVFLIW